MKRTLMPGLAAAIGLSFTADSMAALTAAEIRQWYGGALINDAPEAGEVFGGGVDLSTNPVVQVMPGDIVYLPIWIKPQLGDKTEGLTSIRFWHFEQYGAGDIGSFMFVGGDTRDTEFYLDEDEPAAGNGGPHDDCPSRFQMVDRMGARAGSDEGFATEGGLPFDDAENQAYFLGYVAFQVTGAAGDAIDLYFAVPDDGALRYNTNTTVGSLNTIGYGADGDGGANVARCDNTDLTVIGLVADRSSSVADVTILVIPEPATLVLLAVGALLIRRRSTPLGVASRHLTPRIQRSK